MRIAEVRGDNSPRNLVALKRQGNEVDNPLRARSSDGICSGLAAGGDNIARNVDLNGLAHGIHGQGFCESRLLYKAGWTTARTDLDGILRIEVERLFYIPPVKRLVCPPEYLGEKRFDLGARRTVWVQPRLDVDIQVACFEIYDILFPEDDLAERGRPVSVSEWINDWAIHSEGPALYVSARDQLRRKHRRA